MANFCSSCGQAVSDEARFCAECGNRLEDVEQPAAPEPEDSEEQPAPEPELPAEQPPLEPEPEERLTPEPEPSPPPPRPSSTAALDAYLAKIEASFMQTWRQLFNVDEPEPSQKQPADDKGRSALPRVLKGCSIAVAAVVGLFLLLVIVVAIFAPAEDEGDEEDGAPGTENPPTEADASLQRSFIVFTARKMGNEEIYVMRDDGTDIQQITNHPDSDQDPDWSPDARRIAFASERDGNREIYTMNADGTDIQRLTNHPMD